MSSAIAPARGGTASSTPTRTTPPASTLVTTRRTTPPRRRQLEQPVPGQHQLEHAGRRLRYRECRAAVAVTVAADRSWSLFFTTYGELLDDVAGNLTTASPLPFNLWSNHHPIFGGERHPTDEPHPCIHPGHEPGLPGHLLPTADQPGAARSHARLPGDQLRARSSSRGRLIPARRYASVSGNSGATSWTRRCPTPLTGSAVSAVGNPSAVSTSPPSAACSSSPRRTMGRPSRIRTAAFQTTGSATWSCSSMPARPPPGRQRNTGRDNTIRDVCTIQTKAAQISTCASWGVVQPDDAGVELIGA